jgi:YidC/Oxa1 family membrane protein insertase
MPIFIGIFYVIRQFGGYSLGDRTVPPQYPSFHEGGILWFQNLSNADPTYLLPIISAVTMLASMEITAKNVEPQQRWLMRLLPIGFTIFLLNFPAGLFVYWITSNLVTLGQNFVIYNYGPGKRTSSSGTKGTESGESKAAATEGQTRNSGGEQSSERSQEDIAKQAAKVAKRKRRKKKK